MYTYLLKLQGFKLNRFLLHLEYNTQQRASIYVNLKFVGRLKELVEILLCDGVAFALAWENAHLAQNDM